MARIKPYAILPWIIQRGVWFPCRIAFNFFLKLEIEGIENIPKNNDKLIIASNHISQLDPILIPASLPFFSILLPVFNMSRGKSFYSDTIFQRIFYGGFIFKLLGSYEVETGLNNYSVALMKHIKILNDNNILVIFPEGRISRSGSIDSVKPGVGYLTLETSAKVVPVRISGVHKITLFDFLLRKRKALISFGKPIDFSNLNKDNSNDKFQKYKKISSIISRNISSL
jgi:1-acyl-sn-glycerol-3-phosphate acyltransferase